MHQNNFAINSSEIIRRIDLRSFPIDLGENNDTHETSINATLSILRRIGVNFQDLGIQRPFKAGYDEFFEDLRITSGDFRNGQPYLHIEGRYSSSKIRRPLDKETELIKYQTVSCDVPWTRPNPSQSLEALASQH